MLSHANVVEFVGVAIGKHNKVWILTELMDCDLKSVLERSEKAYFFPYRQIALQIAKAM
jgi:hypothetical protein